MRGAGRVTPDLQALVEQNAVSVAGLLLTTR
jgi:hypothetical protein